MSPKKSRNSNALRRANPGHFERTNATDAVRGDYNEKHNTFTILYSMLLTL
jgi:hypothetical protein